MAAATTIRLAAERLPGSRQQVVSSFEDVLEMDFIRIHIQEYVATEVDIARL
jgi:hypothetical protein